MFTVSILFFRFCLQASTIVQQTMERVRSCALMYLDLTPVNVERGIHSILTVIPVTVSIFSFNLFAAAIRKYIRPFKLDCVC